MTRLTQLSLSLVGYALLVAALVALPLALLVLFYAILGAL